MQGAEVARAHGHEGRDVFVLCAEEGLHVGGGDPAWFRSAD